MNAKIQQLLADALDLSEEDRVQLADLLLESVDPAKDETSSAEWSAELERRVREYENGRARTIPWEEVLSKLESRIRNHAAD